MKKLKTFEIITSGQKSSYVSAFNRKEVLKFWGYPKPIKIVERKDINPMENLRIS